MSIISSVLDGVSRLRADDEATGAPAPYDDFWYMSIGAGSSTGMRVSADTVKRVAAALACVGLIGRMLGAFPSGVYREMPNGGKQLAKNHPITTLLATTPTQKHNHF